MAPRALVAIATMVALGVRPGGVRAQRLPGHRHVTAFCCRYGYPVQAEGADSLQALERLALAVAAVARGQVAA